MEQAEEIGEVRLHEAQAAHVVQFRVAETQAAQVVDFFVDLVDVTGQVDAGVRHLNRYCTWAPGCWWSTACIMVNFVQIGVEQGLDDRHGADYAPGGVNRGRAAFRGPSHARRCLSRAWARCYSDLRSRRGTSISACAQIAAHTAARTGSERCPASNFWK